MLKWKLTALLGLSIGVGGVAWGQAQQQRAPGILRAAHLQGPARQARRPRRAVRESDGVHLRAARHHERRLLDSPGNRHGTRHRRRGHLHLYPRIPVERRAGQAPEGRARRSRVRGSRAQAGAQPRQPPDRQGAQHRHGAERTADGNHDQEVNLLLLETGEARNQVTLDGVRGRHLLYVLKVEPGQQVRVGIVDGPRGTAPWNRSPARRSRFAARSKRTCRPSRPSICCWRFPGRR